MDESQKLSSVRVNLLLPLDISIQIEREIDKRGINRVQFIKEAIHEKLNKLNTNELESELKILKENLRELKHLTLSILDNIKKV